MRASLLIAAGLALVAAPAAAQSWGGYGYEYGDHGSYGDHDGGRYYAPRWGSNAVPSNFDWRSQLDRPGDYRCDRFWDASRDDCGEGWRDQRRRASPQARADYRELAGYQGGYGSGYGYSRYGRGYGHAPWRGYGSRYYSQDRYSYGGTTYEAAYGRPDVVFPGGGYHAGGRDGRRIDWCRATYRSYDPGSGYYRAYSGRLVWCG